MEVALLENIQREDLTAIEEAEAYSNLIKALNITQNELEELKMKLLEEESDE